MRCFAALAFFLSGMASLIYQVAWQRVLTQELACDTVSISFVVSICLAGFAIGAFLGGKLCYSYFSSNREYYVKLYCTIEVVLGIAGFFLYIFFVLLTMQYLYQICLYNFFSIPCYFYQ